MNIGYVSKDICVEDLRHQSVDDISGLLYDEVRQIGYVISKQLEDAGIPVEVRLHFTNIRDEEKNPLGTIGNFRSVVIWEKQLSE